jgi:hypothetical protein
MQDAVLAMTDTNASHHHTPMVMHLPRRMHIIVAVTHTNIHTGRTPAPTHVPMCAHAAMPIPLAPTPIHYRTTIELGLLTWRLTRH